ncbi:hypothetical protein A9D60_02955 [Leisingera sp. JC1]|nr:hypothetical protein A9D60_02955 [Leisingera sp. JC1]
MREAIVYNISYSGFAVRLPDEGQNSFSLAELQSVSIEDIAEFEVRTRWRKDARIGFAFLSKRGARPILDAYFTKNGEFPT